MRVRLDAGVRAAGIAAYAEGLATALGEVADVSVVRPRGGLVSRLVWRERNRDPHADVLVMTNPELPLRRVAVPTVVVVHDVFPLTSPSLTGRSQRLRFKLLLPRVLAKATHVVCVSEATRSALLEHVPVDRGKVSVIGEGPSAFPVLPHEPDTDDPYLLFVGEPFPRKNLDTLIAALDGRRLVVAGPGQVRGVEHVGFVSPQRLAELYAGATALVLPSLDEGFGRPLLDAFARDVPAIASDIPALRELSAGAAELVADPGDPAAWRAALSRDRQSTERGRERAKAYAWTTIARQWEELLRSLTASTRRSSGR